MTIVTPITGMEKPESTDGVNELRHSIGQHADRVEALVPMGVGFLAARPLPGHPGAMYRSTDETCGDTGQPVTYVDDGTQWRVLTGPTCHDHNAADQSVVADDAVVLDALLVGLAPGRYHVTAAVTVTWATTSATQAAYLALCRSPGGAMDIYANQQGPQAHGVRAGTAVTLIIDTILVTTATDGVELLLQASEVDSFVIGEDTRLTATRIPDLV